MPTVFRSQYIKSSVSIQNPEWKNYSFWMFLPLGCPSYRSLMFSVLTARVFFICLPLEFLPCVSDCWHSDVPPHLAQPCNVALGRALIWGFCSCEWVSSWMPSKLWILLFSQLWCQIIIRWAVGGLTVSGTTATRRPAIWITTSYF